MQFGVKQAVEPEYDPDAAGAQGSYIKYFKDKATTLIFLEEIPEWTSVWMHFNQTKNRDYPCTDDRPTCPGHNSENEREAKAAHRYIVNAFNPETGYVDLYKIPYSLMEDLHRYNGKFNTIKDRPYTIYKDQVSGQTKYSIDREDPVDTDLSEARTQLKDHQEALAEAFREVWGALPGEDGYTGLAMFSVDDEPISQAGYLKPLDTPRQVEKSWKDDLPADPPSEPAADEDEGQRELTVEQLNAMDVNQVIEVYKIAKLPVPPFTDHDDLVRQLVTALS